MQIIIPSITEQFDGKGQYIAYDIYVNGVYFASVRYSIFLNLHEELKSRKLIPTTLIFPGKKLFSLNQEQITQRREQLEAYMRSVLHLPNMATCPVLTDFFRLAQQITFQLEMYPVEIKIIIPNGEIFNIECLSTDTTEELLLLIAKKFGFPDELMHHFNLFIMRVQDEEELDAEAKPKKSKHAKYTRILMPYESPFLAVETPERKVQLVFHTLFYDAIYLSEILPFEQATETVYKEIVHECKLGLMGKPDASTQEKMKRLKAEKNVKEFLKVSRSLPYFGSIHVDNCHCDLPKDMEVSIKINTVGVLLLDPTDTYGAHPLYEYKLNRLKCWRVVRSTREGCKYSLTFEYLFDKTTLKWVTISSEQSLYLSIVIQTVINEYIMKNDNTTYKDLGVPDMRTRHSRKLSSFIKKGRFPSSTSEAGNETGGAESPIRSPEKEFVKFPKKTSASVEDDAFTDEISSDKNEQTSNGSIPNSSEPESEEGATNTPVENRLSTITVQKSKKKSNDREDFVRIRKSIKEIEVGKDDAAGNKLFQMRIGDDDL